MRIFTVIFCSATLFFYSNAFPDELPTIVGAMNSGSVSLTSYSKKIEHEAGQGSSSAQTSVTGRVITFKKLVFDDVSIGAEYSQRFINKKNDTPPANFTNAGRLGRQVNEFNLFADFQLENLTVTPSFRIGSDDYELDRPDTTTGLLAMSSTNGRHYGLNLEVAGVIPIAKGIFVRPTVEIDYSYLAVNSSIETGAGPANISYDKIEDERITGEIGLGIGAALPLNNKVLLMPFLNSKIRHNFITGPITTGAKLATSQTDLGEVVLSSGEEQQGWLVDVGTYIFANEKTELLIAYQGEYFPSTTTHGVAFKMSFKF